MPHIFFLGKYLFRMYEIHAQYNWMFPLHMLFFHIISIYVYGLTPGRNNGMHAFPLPARSLSVRTWLGEQETSWYREDMHALVSHWLKAVDLDGDYVEK
jgi:hypothetical protein